MLLSNFLWYFEVLICYQRWLAIVVCDLILWLLYCVTLFSVASDAAPAAAGDVYVVTMHQQNNRWQINGFLCSFNDTSLWVCLAQPSFFRILLLVFHRIDWFVDRFVLSNLTVADECSMHSHSSHNQNSSLWCIWGRFHWKYYTPPFPYLDNSH